MGWAVVRAGEARKRRAESELKRERAARRISGGNGKRDPPVPIPNTEVKHFSGEDSLTGKKSTLPG